jgi:hypothetical protein
VCHCTSAFLSVFKLSFAQRSWCLQMPLNVLALPYSYAFSSIFVNRLLIAVRSAYYNPAPGLECRTDDITLRFEANTVVISGHSIDNRSHPEQLEHRVTMSDVV